MRMEIFTEEVVRMNNNENSKVSRVAFSTSIKEGSGPSRELIVEAFLHAKDKDFRIPIEFSFDINPLEVDLRDLRITSIQHEDGSGFCFNLGGTLEIFFHKTDSSHLGKFSAFYDAKRRRGTFQVTRVW